MNGINDHIKKCRTRFIHEYLPRYVRKGALWGLIWGILFIPLLWVLLFGSPVKWILNLINIFVFLSLGAISGIILNGIIFTIILLIGEYNASENILILSGLYIFGAFAFALVGAIEADYLHLGIGGKIMGAAIGIIAVAVFFVKYRNFLIEDYGLIEP